MAKIHTSLAEWENAVKVFQENGIDIPEDVAAQEQHLRDLEKEKAKSPIFSKLEEHSKYKPYTAEFKKCVTDTVEKLMENTENATQPGLLLGRIQCGKTNTFVNIMGYAFDKGFDVAIVLTKGTNALARQTVERLLKEFAFIANAYVKDIMVLKDRQLTNDILNSKKLIIVCKKEDDNLKHLTKLFTDKQPLLKTKKVLVIDDEADFASINYQKKHGKWYSAVIAKQIQDFITIPEYCRYLQVTATPYSLYLQPGETLNLENGKVEPFHPRFTSIVPTHDGYIGGKQYFIDSQNPESMYYYLYHPVSDKCIDIMKVKNRSYIKNIMTGKNLLDFRYTLLSYMVATIIRKIQTDFENQSLAPDKQKSSMTSCLIHLDVAKNKMIWQDELVKEYFEGVKSQLNGSPYLEFEEMLQAVYDDFKASNEAGNKQKLLNNLIFPTYNEVIKSLKEALNNNSYIIQVVNSDKKVENLLNDDGQLELTSLMNIFIGGSILDRGITIDRMLSFFYGRNPKKFQQDTVLQHARMYGNRSKEDMSVTRLHTTPFIHSVMEKMNDLDDRLREQIENNADASLVFLNYVGGAIQPCSKSKIAIANTLVIKPGMRRTVSGFQTGPKTQIAKTIAEIDKIITSQPGYIEKRDLFEIDKKTVIDIIRKIKTTYVYDEAPDRQWENFGLNWNENDIIDCIEWCTRNTEGKMLCLHHTNLNASRYRNTTDRQKFTDAPETGSTDLRLVHEKAIDMPAIILLRENGEECQGWRGTPFYWPVFVAQQKVETSIFTLDSDTRVKEYIEPNNLIIDGINSEDILHLTLTKDNMMAIESGEKRIEYRIIDEESASKYLERDINGQFMLSRENVQNIDDLTAGIHSFNNGLFPFVARSYKYILFHSTRDAKADLLLVEINPNNPCDFGYAQPRIEDISDTLVKNREETDFIDQNFTNWIIAYHFRPIKLQKFNEELVSFPNEDFNNEAAFGSGEEDNKISFDNETDNNEANNNEEENIEIKPDEGDLLITVDSNDIWRLSGKGYIVGGKIESGTVHQYETVLISNGKKSIVEYIELADPQGKFYAQWATKGEFAKLFLGSLSKGDLDNVDNLTIEAIKNPNNDFEMTVSGKESVKGKGVVITGKVDSGTISIGDPVIISKYEDGGIMKSACVTTIEINGNQSETASAGQIASIGFKSLTARNNVDKTITTKINRE